VAYSPFLAVMAATALMSRFPLKTVGLGALMFVVSDLLIFARMGPLANTMLTSAWASGASTISASC
jgi:uncharacterized membrane protein YhhN